MNKTKVIATIGPASESVDVLKGLMMAGMDVARFNMRYASYDFCLKAVQNIRKLNEELHTNVAIMLDLNGPKVQVGRMSTSKVVLKKEDRIRIYMDDILGDETKFSVSYPKLIDDVKYNTEILLRDGNVRLKVVDKDLNYILCEVIDGGEIREKDTIHIPSVKMSLPFISTKDKDDILFAHKIGADFLALSFVQSGEDVLEVNDLLIELGNDHLGIVAKIENEPAIEEIDEIIKVSDGILIARGDLGVEIPMERVPGVQKMIINKCHLMGKVSIVATSFFSSTNREAKPTRAEVSDVANAVLDSVDAILLSLETTIGSYPIETLTTMHKIIETSELDINYYELLDKSMRSEKQDTTGSLVYSVTECANRLKCKAIVAPTMSGYTARKMSRFRPSCPVLAVSPNLDTVRSLALHFAVRPVLIDELHTLDKMIDTSKKIAKEFIAIDKGDRIIITGGYPFKEVKHTNFMKIEEL